MQAAVKARPKKQAVLAAVPTDPYRSRVETITPEMAIKWLERNISNRKLVQSSVDAYAADIKAGKWMLTGDPIQFDINGDMINGQHRLWAVVEANQPIRSQVARGLPVEAKLVLDTGKKRTLANYFQITGEKNATVLGGVLNIVYNYDDSRWTRSERGPTHSEAQVFLEDNPDLRFSAELAQKVRSAIRMAPSPIGAAHAINARIDPQKADEFWERVHDGVGLEAGSPILAYQRWTTRVLATKKDKPSSRTQFAHAMKAMDAWYHGKQVRLLNWNVGDPIPADWGSNGSTAKKKKKAA